MFIIEQLIDGSWVPASSHTNPDDRTVQLQRFLDAGIPTENLRTQEN